MHKVNQASIPRSEKVLGRANCAATDAVGDCVKITGAQVGNRYQVTSVDVTSPGDPPAVAIIVRKDAATECIVQFHGPIHNVYATLTPGQYYAIGTDAELTATVPTPAPSGIVYAQIMGKATSDDEFFVNPGQRTKLKGF